MPAALVGTGGVERPLVGTGLARGRYRASRLSSGTIPLAPRSVGAILDTAAELLAARFAPLFAVGFCLWVPATTLMRMIERTNTAPGAVQFLIEGCVEALVASFACVFVGAMIEGRKVSATDAFLAVLVRLPGLLFLSLLVGISTFLVFICCIGVLPLWLFAVAPSVYMIERCHVLRSLRRSITLVRSGGAFVRWIGYSLVGSLMTLPFLRLQEAMQVLDLHDRLRSTLALSDGALDLAIAAIGAPYLAVGTAFLGVVQAVFYFDLRVRNEGYDLERRLAEIAPEEDEA